MRRLVLLALFVALLCVNPINAVVVPEYAQNPSVDGHITYVAPNYTRNVAAATLSFYGSSGATFRRAFIKWDLTAIPDGATLIQGSIYLRTAGTVSNAFSFYPITNEPSAASDAVLYADAGDGTIYLTQAGLAINTDYTETLTAQMLTDIQAGLTPNWFAVGIYYVGAGAAETLIHSLESATPAYRPILTIRYSHLGVTYTFTSHLEDGTNNYPETLTVSSSDGVSVIVLAAPATYGFTVRPNMISWDIAAGVYRRITPLASTGAINFLTPEAAYSTFTVNVRDYTGVTQSETTYLETYRIVSGASTLVECVPITNTINGIPVTLTVNRIYDLKADTSTTDYTYSFYATTATPSPIVILDTLAFSQVFQYNTRFIHVEATRPTDTSLQVDYADDLLDTTLVQIRILNSAGVLVQAHNETADSFSWTSAAVTNTTKYQVQLWITHADLGNLIYSEVFDGVFAAPAVPTLGALGTFGGMAMGQAFGAGIVVLFAGLFSARNVVVGAVLTCLLTALLAALGFLSISSGVIVLALSAAVMYGLGRQT